MMHEKAIKDLFDFSDRVLIITGGAGAIGSAAAELFSELGAHVVISDINEEGVKRVATEIADKTGNATLGVVADSTKEEDMNMLVDKTVDKFGKVSGLVNNVGWGASTPTFGSNTEKMVNSYILNTVGAYNLTKFCMPYLEKEENASVLFSGSLVGTSPSPEFIEYSTAKAGLLHMVKSMAVVGGPKVRFNSIVIGSVDNGEATLKAGYTEEMLRNLNNMFVMKRRGFPIEIAYGMMYLMSKAAAWVTGSQLVINGGGVYQSKMPKSD